MVCACIVSVKIMTSEQWPRQKEYNQISHECHIYATALVKLIACRMYDAKPLPE